MRDLYVEFQPIVWLPSGLVYGHEVLGRGPASPGALLDEAARAGALRQLDWEWRQVAIESIAGGDREGVFFLNVDTRVIDDPEFAPGSTLALLERHGLLPGQFVLELSERGEAMASSRIESLAEHYKRQGFRIALDDLGAGYSSLTTVVRARPDLIKIDMELVRDLDGDPLRRELVRALAEFSRRAGVPLIAEGIESWCEVEALLAVGVQLGQGYLLGRPASRVAAPSWEVAERLRAETRPLRAPSEI
jgi:EAL domain-containing protein (putative c-di-GMP-specific phosphodiesterase class I)